MSMHRWVASLAVGTVLSASVATGLAQEKAGQPAQPGKPEAKKEAASKLPLCPVTGDAVNFAVSVMADDGPVYFCCPDCIKKYEADAKKFADKVKEQRAAVAKLPKVQVKCPVSGKPVSKDQFVEVNGQKVYFCCGKCPAQYKEDPAKFKAKLAASYTYQTRCPVSGEEIDPTAFADLPDGNRVYYCCMACDPQVRKDPAKFAMKLEEQGTWLDVKKIQAAASEAAKPGKSDMKHDEKEQKHDEKH